MKQKNNNEIDALLRSLARGKRGESPLGVPKASRRDDATLSDHLDADELNSFAEGVLPALARARYAAHLADCGSCRAIAVNLQRATGAATSFENVEPEMKAGFWQKLASFLSPPVLRYAVPALALTAIIAISLMALRQQRRPDLVAQNETTNSTPPLAMSPQQPAPSVTQSHTQAPERTPNSTELGAGLSSSGEKRTAQPTKSGEDKAPAETTASDAPVSSVLKDSAPGKQGYVAGPGRPVFAPEPNTAPPPPPAKTGVSEDEKSGALQKVEVARGEVQTRSRGEEKDQPSDDAGRHGPARSNTTTAGNRRSDGLMTERAESRAKSKRDSDDAVVTRTVSGKRFRRQDSAWIDTAYDSSQRTINVSRDSEQFRALVADEPGVRTIAETLHGVVIVVWKGRAYRIQ